MSAVWISVLVAASIQGTGVDASGGHSGTITFVAKQQIQRAALTLLNGVLYFPYAGYAELLGLAGIRVEDPEELGAAWDRALAADRPVVLEVRTDPDVPLLPPFPAGGAKLDTFRAALEQEGPAGERARRLLDTYADQEARRHG